MYISQFWEILSGFKRLEFIQLFSYRVLRALLPGRVSCAIHRDFVIPKCVVDEVIAPACPRPSVLGSSLLAYWSTDPSGRFYVVVFHHDDLSLQNQHLAATVCLPLPPAICHHHDRVLVVKIL